jgi:methanogenic corrinoid protein MtbC1
LNDLLNEREDDDMDRLAQTFSALEEDRVYQLVNECLEKSITPLLIVNELSRGMEKVGQLFKDDEYALAELIYAGEIFKEAMEKIKPLLLAGESRSAGLVIMGTVEGDIHDLGKNIVITMLECSGFKVIDLGVDVPAKKFVEAIKESGASLIGMSLLLTTAMDSLRNAIMAIEEAGIRNNIKIMIGGAPVSEHLRVETGADYLGRDAVEALTIARKVFSQSTVDVR